MFNSKEFCFFPIRFLRKPVPCFAQFWVENHFSLLFFFYRLMALLTCEYKVLLREVVNSGGALGFGRECQRFANWIMQIATVTQHTNKIQ